MSKIKTIGTLVIVVITIVLAASCGTYQAGDAATAKHEAGREVNAADHAARLNAINYAR